MIYLSNINKHNAPKRIETLRGKTSILVSALSFRAVLSELRIKRYKHKEIYRCDDQ